MDGWVDTRLFRSLNNLSTFSNTTYQLLKITDSFSSNIVFVFKGGIFFAKISQKEAIY